MLYKIHKVTVRHWFKEGLSKIDENRPFLVRGSDLCEFLKNRQSKNKQKCKPDELYCMRCRESRKPKEMKVIIEKQAEKISRLKGVCSVCGTKMFRAFSAKNYQQITMNFKIIKTHHKDILQSDVPVVNAHLKEET